MAFDGFPSGAPMTVLPQALLRDLAPAMTDPAELIVTLYAMELIGGQRRFPRRVRAADLREQRPLIGALAGVCVDREVDEAYEDGLSAAVRRGSLLLGRMQSEGRWTEWLALNDADGRRALKSASMPASVDRVTGRDAAYSSAPEIWQSAFGTPMPPILAEELKAAEARYGADWLFDAFAESAANNARSWRYVRAILERWETEGRDGGDATTGTAAGGLESSRYRHLFRE
ncbi:MAG: DnaD domain protein [Chloroflexi bacterium]|nr:DnaD domain protein [Chloroflexota bacterium]MCY3695932.1 DnaD domain protein [Chloroflexota bacterium]MXX31411.1 DnaD domain protein [Chloroflexota bacterium]MYD15952.1 DnaD domain protein [Chloroflexota bacterium]